jgi:hypothetical protein
VEGTPIKRLSQEEQAERRRLGLCFNCNERYSRGHNRFCRRLFFVDGITISDEETAAGEAHPDAEAPVFSLRAVAGVPSCDTLQVRVDLGAVTLVALLDTGSTHNFIGEDAAHRSGLAIQPRPRLTATVANGERITCPGVIRQAPISISGEPFQVDLFVMPLTGYDLVLGTQWLVTLGRIVWDFQDRTMSFTRQGRAVCWTDVATVRPPRIAQQRSLTLSSTGCSVHSPTSSRHRRASHRRVLGTMPSSSSPAPPRWPSGHTGTPRHTRMSWSASARR